MTDLLRKVHVLSLHDGDTFRFTQDGELFRLAVELNDKGKPSRYLAQHADGSRGSLAAAIEYEGCFVYRVDLDSNGEGDDS